MRNDPDTVNKAYVIDFGDDMSAKQDRAHVAGFGCHLCDRQGYFADALGDKLFELQQRHSENIHLICTECDETYDVTTINT